LTCGNNKAFVWNATNRNSAHLNSVCDFFYVSEAKVVIKIIITITTMIMIIVIITSFRIGLIGYFSGLIPGNSLPQQVFYRLDAIPFTQSE